MRTAVALALLVCLMAGIAAVPCREVRADEVSKIVSADGEFRGVWICFDDFKKSRKYSEEEFTAYAAEMFDNVVDAGCNAVMVHVRAFCDAMYKSKYFPWSYYASGKQGKNPGYDPLTIMVELAHERGLEIHAWINPYRVLKNSTDISSLSKKSPARKWYESEDPEKNRNVLIYDNYVYLNPAKKEVRKLIVNGVKEIVKNYDVDGIHFDDYFYPALGSKYQTVFDAPEYEEYKAAQLEAGKEPKTIAEWRYANVNTLVKSVYKAVKFIDKNCVFGIAPGGFIDYFTDRDSDTRWYVDYRTWMSQKGYVDYIAPELYWSFNTINRYPFYETLLKWLAARKNPNVKVYVGLPLYKTNSSEKIGTANPIQDTEWRNPFIIADMINYTRKTTADGFILFDYADIANEKKKVYIDNMKEAW